MSDELDKALADVKKEGTSFEDVLKETESDSPTETKPETEAPEEGAEEGADPSTLEEDNVPFHKHPRWIERDNELKTLRQQTELMTRELAEFREMKEEDMRGEPVEEEIPDWFKTLYGNNRYAWRKYRDREEVREKEIEQRVLDRQYQVQHVQRQWYDWVGNQVENVGAEIEAEGGHFDRNDFIKTMLETRPTDDGNNFDFQAGKRIYMAMHRETVGSDARKRIADATAHRSSQQSKSKDYFTTEDLRNKSWTDL